jgi:hypothetical protein
MSKSSLGCYAPHGGSNGINIASIMLQPYHDFAMVLATNVGGTQTDQGLQASAEELYRRFGPAAK